jgi:tetratricopeptide (TPR) repeat protein
MAVRSAIRNPDWKSTEAVWDAIVRDHPESNRSQSVNGWRMLQAGNLDLARGYYELANRIWPDDAMLLNNLAGINIQLGRYEDAIPILERSRELTDLLGNTEQMLAFAYLSAGQPGPALDAVHRADRFDIDPVLRNALRAQAYAGLGRHEYASAALRNVVRTARGDTPDLRMLLARELARAGYVDLALAAADTALARTQPGTPIRTAVERLRSAIGRGCYDPASHSTAPDPSQPCVDPLAGWPVVLPPGAQEVANPLQNATGREAAEPGGDRTTGTPKR